MIRERSARRREHLPKFCHVCRVTPCASPIEQQQYVGGGRVPMDAGADCRVLCGESAAARATRQHRRGRRTRTSSTGDRSNT